MFNFNLNGYIIMTHISGAQQVVGVLIFDTA